MLPKLQRFALHLNKKAFSYLPKSLIDCNPNRGLFTINKNPSFNTLISLVISTFGLLVYIISTTLFALQVVQCKNCKTNDQTFVLLINLLLCFVWIILIVVLTTLSINICWINGYNQLLILQERFSQFEHQGIKN